jgi:hypothetical protein
MRRAQLVALHQLVVLVPLSLLCWLVLSGGAAAQDDSPQAARYSPQQAAALVDATLQEELSVGSAGTALVDDATFLRRASLDLIGRPPTPQETALFSLDPDPDKRRQLVQRLLADEGFGQNWGRYWRDVIMYRRSDQQALIAMRSLERFLTEQFNSNASWGQIVRTMLTATGDVQENGATGLFMAQNGQRVEVASEVARIFLGIQIQCAQCHDHPTDRWKREQFHELVAFFPRMAVRPVQMEDRRSFEVVSFNGFSRFGRGGGSEHYMPDLNNPQARGTLMTPRFFLTNESLRLGSSDEQRRSTLAQWITSPDNPWFAKAFVNRVWGELLGEGFYMPLDDLGPDRECSAPRTLDLLAGQFAQHDYDVKWLYETVLLTQAYQRESRPRRTANETPFAANCPQRLRGDQLLAALRAALDLTDQMASVGRRGGFGFGFGGLAFTFNQTFGFDPSLPREEVTDSIPQALFMMNSPLVQSQIDARRPQSVLGRMLSRTSDDRAVVADLYVRCLNREPTPREMTTCLEYIQQVGNRGEAFEDILWALINSTEFLHRR